MLLVEARIKRKAFSRKASAPLTRKARIIGEQIALFQARALCIHLSSQKSRQWDVNSRGLPSRLGPLSMLENWSRGTLHGTPLQKWGITAATVCRTKNQISVDHKFACRD